jgi:hypothetical protein
MGFEAMRMLGSMYTLVVIWGAVWMATRVRPAGREPVVWLAVPALVAPVQTALTFVLLAAVLRRLREPAPSHETVAAAATVPA